MVTTTQWKSAFSYDNLSFNYGDIFYETDSQYIVVLHDGDYWAFSGNHYSFVDGGLKNEYGGQYVKYYKDSGLWGSQNVVEAVEYEKILSEYGYFPGNIVAQNIDKSVLNYYSSAQFRSGNIYAPSGSFFDSIYTDSVFSEVLSVFPIIFSVFAVYIAIRKGIVFVYSQLKGV